MLMFELSKATPASFVAAIKVVKTQDAYVTQHRAFIRVGWLQSRRLPTVLMTQRSKIMRTTRIMVFALAALITVLLANTAQAQKGVFVSFKGIEIHTGHEEAGEAYGWMCYAKTTGALPGNFTLTMDFAGVKGPGTSTDVTGGAWTLPVYTSTKVSRLRPILEDPYQGVVFGSVEGGGISWDKDGASATVELKLLIRGGTQAMSEMRGSAYLYGTVVYDDKGRGTFEGTIYFDLL